jgi:AraC-like DNA-binding protein
MPTANACKMILPSTDLRHCVRGYFDRDTSAMQKEAACRITHVPASPYWTMLWQIKGSQTIIFRDGLKNEPIKYPAALLGPSKSPWTACSDGPYHAFIVLLLPGVVQELAGLGGSSWINGQCNLSEILGESGSTLSNEILNSKNNIDRINLVERYFRSELKASWRSSFLVPGRLSHWLNRLATSLWMAHAYNSRRNFERKVNFFTALSWGNLKRMSRVESTLLHAVTDQELGKQVSWSDISAVHEYADQSHMCREVKQITGFSPQTLQQRYVDPDDEAFWFYKAWL